MDNLVLRKGFIIDGNVVKCLLILKNGLEFVGVSKSSCVNHKITHYDNQKIYHPKAVCLV